MFNSFFYDPRKLFIAGFLGSLLVMAFGVMDYIFVPFHYIVLFVLIASQIPLFLLGPIRTQVKIETPNIVGWAMLFLAFMVIVLNIKINGLPLLLKAILGGSLTIEQTGEYYHKKLRLTAILWPLLTILIPMSLLVKNKLLKYLLFLFGIISSFLIQIKAPFIFGFIFFLIIFQLTGRRLKSSQLVFIGVFGILLFIGAAATRTSDNFSTIAVLMGVSPSYHAVSPLIWFPLSYIGGPIANGFHQMGTHILEFYFRPFFLILPETLLKDETRTIFQFKNGNPLPWPETNNAVSAIGSISNMFGLIGMFIFVFLLSFLIYYLVKKRFLGNVFLLSVFIVSIKNISLFPIGNYFIDPSFLGELFFFYLVLTFSKITITNLPQYSFPSLSAEYLK